MRYAQVLNGIVTGVTTIHQEGVTFLDTTGVSYEIGDDVQVEAGATCTLVDGEPVFSIVQPPMPALTPMTLYMAFTPQERITIKASTDPMVREFWDMYQLSVQLQKNTDPNLVSVQNAIAFMAQTADDTPPGPGIYAKSRIPQILAGIPQ